MTKFEVWKIYSNRNPKFSVEDESVTFTSKGLYQFFERTWDLAHSEGVKNGQAIEAMKTPAKNPQKSYGDGPLGGFEEFSNLFGGKL